MAVKARPEPDPKHPGADLSALVPHLAKIGDAHGVFARHLQVYNTGPQIETVVLTSDRPIATDQAARDCVSLGVLNPSDVTIYWGVGGSNPQPGGRAIAQPAKSLMVLPIQVGDLKFGADVADLAAGDVPLTVLRFSCVQPVFLGAAA